MKDKRIFIIMAFIATYVIWGTTYLAIAVGLTGFGPFTLSAFRYLAAGFILLTVCFIKKQSLPSGKDLGITVVSGIIMLVGGSGLICWAEQSIQSGHAAVLIATEPFFFILLDRKRWSFYRSQKNIIAGLAIGFVGVAWFVCFTGSESNSGLKNTHPFLSISVLILSAILWVLGSLLFKTTTEKNIAITSTISVQLLAAGLFSLFLSIVLREKNLLHMITAKAWLSLGYLVIFGSIIAYFAFNWLMTVRPPAQVSTHTYVNPVVALFAGWMLGHESVSLMQIIGLIVILTGVMLTNKPLQANVPKPALE